MKKDSNLEQIKALEENEVDTIFGYPGGAVLPIYDALFKNKKIKTKNTHGTGCTLSSAIATFLSCGKPLKKSCELGVKYVNQAIDSNLNYGKGHGPINHLNSILIDKKFR